MTTVHNLFVSSIGARRVRQEQRVIRVAIWSERGSHIASASMDVPEARRFSVELAKALAKATVARLAQ